MPDELWAWLTTLETGGLLLCVIIAAGRDVWRGLIALLAFSLFCLCDLLVVASANG